MREQPLGGKSKNHHAPHLCPGRTRATCATPFKGTGSGFLVHVDGKTGLVVTNHHVIQPLLDDFSKVKKSRYTLVFDSGTRLEKFVAAELLGSDPSCDLALLRVRDVESLPAPIAMTADFAPPLETTTFYSFGFPFGDMLSFSKKNPAITVGKGTVSSVRDNEFGQFSGILLDGELNPGNSGGPIVGVDGKLMASPVRRLETPASETRLLCRR